MMLLQGWKEERTMPIMIDMEKPKRCEDCPIDYDQVCCNLGAKRYYDDEWKDEEERLYGRTYSDECPLKEIVLCKDCKHRPLPGSEAPLLDDAEAKFEGERDYKCPCLCYDSYYAWTPKDNFFCGYGERRTDG